MPVDPPFNVYRDQLTSQYHGLALWNPNPPKAIYNHVSIGDVGYVREGVFIRMFNVILPWDHESNRTLGEPEPYESLDCGPFTKILEVPLKTQEHYSRYVSPETNDNNAQAREPDNAEGVTYNCRGHGALLLLPHGGHRADIIRTKVFEDYIRDHVVSWFTWAQKNQQAIERMEDLILVSGCTLVSSWAAAAFVYNTMEAKISLARRTLSNGGECFIWGNIRGSVEYHDSNISPQNPPMTPDLADQCVFIRGFRAKRVLFWTKPMRAAAEPLPDDPDNDSDDVIQVTRVPDGPKYRDPLIGILDYIVEKCPKDAKDEDTIAVAHDDDLRLIKDVEILTADAIEEFLRENQIPLLVENGAATLRDSPGARQVTVERHESQSQQETRLPSSHRLAKAASMSLLGNRPQFGSLLALVTSQMTAEKNEGQLPHEARPPSFHRLAKAASMSALGDRQPPAPQFGSLLTSGTSQLMEEIHEDQPQRVTRSPSSRRLAKAASMSALGNRQSSKSIQFGSLLYVGTSQMTAEKHEGRPRRASVLNFI